MEEKGAEIVTTQTPLIDSRKVIAAALEENSPDHWDNIKITGLIHKTVGGEEIPKFTILIIDGEIKTPGELTAFPDDVQRYNDELAKLESK